MSASLGSESDGDDPVRTLPSKYLPSVPVRDLPEPPSQRWRIIGPGLVSAGIGLASGEFILWPFIASQVGLVFLWGAVLGVVTQWFLNMEIERYTLATGETALTGFSRFWRHWGLFFVVMTYFSNMWPGWATSSATMVSYLFGGSVRWISIGILVVIGVSLTLAPVVYVFVERVIFLKVAAIVFFIVVAMAFAISTQAWADLPRAFSTEATFPAGELGFALVLGALAFSGAGGGHNLVQSNWIRDKGFGMGAHIPRLKSPVTGEDEAIPSIGFQFEPTQENLSRWRRWWRFANVEQLVTFPLVTIFTIVFMSMLAYSTVYARPGLSDDIGFLLAEGQQLKETVAPWFGTFFWAIGAFGLFAGAMGIIDYTSRLSADMLKTTYLRNANLTENQLYFWLVWGLVAFGVLVLLLGLEQPLVLLVISACTAGTMMFIYSILLIILNRRALPRPLQIRNYRVAALLWSTGLFGFLAVLTIINEAQKLF